MAQIARKINLLDLMVDFMNDNKDEVMSHIASSDYIMVEKQSFPNELLFHENITGRFKKAKQERRKKIAKNILIAVTAAVIVGLLWSVVLGGDPYSCMGIAVSLALLMGVTLQVVQLFLVWPLWVFMGNSGMKAHVITERHKTEIAEYYTELLWTDAIKKHLSSSDNSKVAQLIDLKVSADISSRVANTPIIKKDVIVVGDFDFNGYSKVISITLEFNQDNSALTMSKYEVLTKVKSK